MNDFEKLLHGILDTTNSFWNARYIGRACYAPVTEDLRIKAELHSTLVSEHYTPRSVLRRMGRETHQNRTDAKGVGKE